eukprot:SAG31_NODE_240_length_19407_cov_29.686140_18_plen_148_part_00
MPTDQPHPRIAPILYVNQIRPSRLALKTCQERCRTPSVLGLPPAAAPTFSALAGFPAFPVSSVLEMETESPGAGERQGAMVSAARWRPSLLRTLCASAAQLNPVVAATYLATGPALYAGRGRRRGCGCPPLPVFGSVSNPPGRICLA